MIPITIIPVMFLAAALNNLRSSKCWSDFAVCFQGERGDTSSAAGGPVAALSDSAVPNRRRLQSASAAGLAVTRCRSGSGPPLELSDFKPAGRGCHLLVIGVGVRA